MLTQISSMKFKPLFRALAIGFFLVVLLRTPVLIQAQDLSLGMAQSLPIEDENLRDGQIIAIKDNTYHLSTEAYDKNIVGVLSSKSAMSIRYGSNLNTRPVVSNGQAAVRVNADNGPIRQGDRLTSSTTPGVAMRATKTGFILGVAQEDFTPTGSETDVVLVALDIGFDFAADSPDSEQIGSRLLSVLQVTNLAFTEDPLSVFRYVVGAVVMISTLIFTFMTFGRAVRNGTEALGRNPIAVPQILLGMMLNVAISLALLGTGLGAAYFITTI